MLSEQILGRYEFIGTTNNGNPSSKFWHIVFNKSTLEYIATYGRIGTAGTPHNYSGDYAKVQKLIKQKINKGYNKVQGYNETIGSNSVHFIKTA